MFCRWCKKDAWKITLGGLTDRGTRKERSSISWQRFRNYSITRTTWNCRTSKRRTTPWHNRSTWVLSKDSRHLFRRTTRHGVGPKDEGLKCSSMDIQKKICKAGKPKWKKQDSVTMQNAVNHFNYEGCVGPVKQSPECHLAVNIVREREQEQGLAGRHSKQEEQHAYPQTSWSYQWDRWDGSWQWTETWTPRWVF